MSSLEWQDSRHKVSEEHARIPGGRSPKTATIRITPTKSQNLKALQAKKVAKVAELKTFDQFLLLQIFTLSATTIPHGFVF